MRTSAATPSTRCGRSIPRPPRAPRPGSPRPVERLTMPPLSVGKNYCLRLPDGRVLGHVRIERLVDWWAEGPFTPTSAFAEYRELFERETQMRRDQIIPLWEQAVDSIEALQITAFE